jgi:hypothetical protein
MMITKDTPLVEYPEELVTTYSYVPPVVPKYRWRHQKYSLSSSGMHHNGKPLQISENQGTSYWQEPEWVQGLDN